MAFVLVHHMHGSEHQLDQIFGRSPGQHLLEPYQDLHQPSIFTPANHLFEGSYVNAVVSPSTIALQT